ncbi:MAG: CBS domain-containing protein [Clostridia bacterium]|nr:CBS domain-containing protein [Clostridia bacterium]
MSGEQSLRSEVFLVMYRRLEGLLEKRYADRQVASGSVVKEYLRDADSEPWRSDLDLCREIRNILSHNIDEAGAAVVEPSQGIVDRLQAIIEHVQRPLLAVHFGTPAENIMFAHPNDLALNVMRHMLKKGYSHVPVADRSGLVGVFSAESLMMYLAEHGLSDARDELRIGDIREALDFGDERSERYMFLRDDATLFNVRDAFEKRNERNNRLAVVFLTSDGTRQGQLVSMLTPWDALRDDIRSNGRVEGATNGR